MSKIIITVEFTYEDIMEHEAAEEADKLVSWVTFLGTHSSYGSDKVEVKSVQVIHQEESK